MGISGLLPALKSITEMKALEEYRGQTLAIDGYCWVDILLRNGITPYVVFDGGPLPMKKGTEVERRAARQKNRELGIQFYKQRNYTEARKHFSRAADVSPFMAHRVIQRLKAKNVRYVVAPYEADAQLAYLTKHGLADGVITEDSDCLPFGCGTVLFKLDKDGVGVAQEIKESNLKKNKGLLFHMFTHEMFLEMCIFSGCDYLPSLPGFGLKKAYTALKQHGSFTKVIRALRLEGKVRIPPTYEADFEKAVLTFRHQRVFDPRSQQLVPLTPISDSDKANDGAMDFLGPMLSDDIATAIADGDMDPITMESFPKSLAAPSVNSNNANFNRGSQFNGTRSTFDSYGASAQQQQQQSEIWKQQPQSFAAVPQGARKFPNSFARRAESPGPSVPLFALTNAKPSSTGKWSSSSSLPSRSAESSPPIVSRFFAAQPKRTSRLAETEKTLDAVPASSFSSSSSAPISSFESQDPLEVDVARSISFSPLEEKKQAHAHVTVENKENHTPTKEEKVTAAVAVAPPPPALKENAFSRMMRAGSLIQKQSQKRKATAGATTSSRYRQQKASMFGNHHQPQHHRSAEQHMQRYAHVASDSSKQSSSVVTVNRAVSSCLTAKTQSSPQEAVESPEPEAERGVAEEDESQSSSSSVVARGSYLVGASSSSLTKKIDFAEEDNRQSHHLEREVSCKPKSSSSVLASLDRFRFKKQ